MEEITITLTREEVEAMLKEWRASSFIITASGDRNCVNWKIESVISSRMTPITAGWQPSSQIESDCEPIIRAACEAAGVTFEDVRSTYRKRSVSDARRIIVSEAYKRFNHLYTCDQIGRMLHRDHTAVVYLKNGFEELMYNSGFRAMYEDYLRYLKEFQKKEDKK